LIYPRFNRLLGVVIINILLLIGYAKISFPVFGGENDCLIVCKVFDMIVATVSQDEERLDTRDRLAGLEGAPSRANGLH